MDDMEQTEKSTTESSEWQQRTGQLVRPVDGRMLAGVAKGVADNFGIAEWIPRVFFVVTAFFGGFGVVLYAAGWAFIRSEDETESAAERFFSGASTSRSWIGIGLMLIAGIIVLSNFTILSGEVVWAAALLVVGLLLYLGYFPGGKQEGDVEPGGSKEGVQRMTPTNTITPETEEAPSGDSPAGGSTRPPTPAPPPPPTPPELPPAKPRESSMLGRLTIGFMLLGLGVLALLDNIDGVAIDADPRHYIALAVTVLGVGLLVGAFAGRARWLILVAAILVPTMIFSPAFEYDWSDRDFDLDASPATFAEVEESYAIDIGQMVIDLRELPWDGEEISIEAAVDAGSLRIYIPAGVGIVGEASVDVGRVSEPGRSSGGLGDPTLTWDDPGESGTVQLEAHVDVGNIDIRR
jgi:phage shock protein PspC (stress-responsive transcriptional regulator)